MDNIAIIITTFLRDDLLEKAVASILNNWQHNWIIIIIDQNPTETKQKIYDQPHISYYGIPYNSGLSYARNYGVQKAIQLRCKYCLIMADSIVFNQSMKNIDLVAKELGIFKLINKHDFDLIGLQLDNRIEWEAKLDLIPGKYFELDFIDKNGSNFCSVFYPLHFRIYRCDIVRNFFIATTESLLDVQWDNNLKMREHEDFFWRYKEKGFKVGCLKELSGRYIGEKGREYLAFRDSNMKEGLSALQKKFGITGWVSYKNIERIRHKKSN